jgi:hypothetical protein
MSIGTERQSGFDRRSLYHFDGPQHGPSAHRSPGRDACILQPGRNGVPQVVRAAHPQLDNGGQSGCASGQPRADRLSRPGPFRAQRRENAAGVYGKDAAGSATRVRACLYTRRRQWRDVAPIRVARPTCSGRTSRACPSGTTAPTVTVPERSATGATNAEHPRLTRRPRCMRVEASLVVRGSDRRIATQW